MRSPRDPAPVLLRVTIVSLNAETLDGLQIYLQEAGVDAHATRQLRPAGGKDHAPDAVVFFPDDFGAEQVLRDIERLHLECPKVVLVIVTSEPRRFEALDTPEGAEPRTVIPKPAWGWTILDAIRHRVVGA